MSDERSLPPEMREQILATFGAMDLALGMIGPRAKLLGLSAEWESIVRQRTALCIRMEQGPLGDDFDHVIEGLCDLYGALAAKALGPTEH